MIRWALLGLVLAGCGPSLIGRPCGQTESVGSGCHCVADPAPIKCVGDWVCNPQRQCQYTCAPACDNGSCGNNNFRCSNDNLCRTTSSFDLIQCN